MLQIHICMVRDSSASVLFFIQRRKLDWKAATTKNERFICFKEKKDCRWITVEERKCHWPLTLPSVIFFLLILHLNRNRFAFWNGGSLNGHGHNTSLWGTSSLHMARFRLQFHTEGAAGNKGQKGWHQFISHRMQLNRRWEHGNGEHLILFTPI